jgi:hypothetical protein
MHRSPPPGRRRSLLRAAVPLFVDSGGGYYRFINRDSGKAIEVPGASTSDGANVVQYSDWNGANQQWQLVLVG